MHLFGFATEAERDLFLMLIGVQNVGPKVALAVLSGGAPRELLAAIATGDVGALPGRARHRQAHRRADHRGAPGEGGRRRERRDRDHAAPPTTRARSRARASWASGFDPAEADELLDAAGGDTPEELIAEALKAAR